MQLYHHHFPLFNELIAEVDSLGINMQNNTVTHVEFSIVRPYNSTHRYLNMAVTSSKGERNFAEAIDFNALPPLFYDVLFGSYEILKDMK